MGQDALIETLAINVLAALLGMSLPLIMQIIDRLDSKYGSAVISASFRKEWVYQVYYYMVWITIVLVLYLPWAPAPVECLRDCWFVNNSAHLLVSFCLGLTLIFLFLVSGKITVYDSPEALLMEKAGNPNPSHNDREKSDKEIERLVNDPDRFAIFGSLMKYSMTIGNIPLFLNCNSLFGFCIGNNNSKALPGGDVTFSDQIYNLINESIRISQRFYDELLYPSLNCPYNFLSVYFNSYGKTIISRKSFEQLWQNVIQLIGCNRSEWFKGYWVYAAQYADYTVAERSEIPYDLKNYFYNKSEIPVGEDENAMRLRSRIDELKGFVKEKRQLCETHHMFLAYLMYVEKIKWLDWCFEYSPSSLNTQLLIPKRIGDVLEELGSIKNGISGPIDFRYPFYQENGIRSSEIIENSLLNFYIYAICKQNRKYKSGGTRINPWTEIDFFGNNESEKAHEIYNLTHLIDILRETLFPNKEYFSSIGVAEEEIKELDEHFVDLKSRLNEKLAELQSKTTINGDDVAKANIILKSAVDKGKIVEGLNQTLPGKTDDNPVEQHNLERTVGVSLSKDDYIWNTDTIFQSMVPTLVAQMNYVVQQGYLRIFFLTSPRRKFYVNYDEIKDALDILNVKRDKYAILPIGLVPPFGTEKYFDEALMRGNRQEIIIIRREFLPAIEGLEVPEMNADENGNNIFFGGKIKVKYSYNSQLRYIRLIIINSLVDGRMSQVNQMSSINYYIP